MKNDESNENAEKKTVYNNEKTEIEELGRRVCERERHQGGKRERRGGRGGGEKRGKSLSILDGKVMKQNKEGEWWELNNHFKAGWKTKDNGKGDF